MNTIDDFKKYSEIKRRNFILPEILGTLLAILICFLAVALLFNNFIQLKYEGYITFIVSIGLFSAICVYMHLISNEISKDFLKIRSIDKIEIYRSKIDALKDLNATLNKDKKINKDEIENEIEKFKRDNPDKFIRKEIIKIEKGKEIEYLNITNSVINEGKKINKSEIEKEIKILKKINDNLNENTNLNKSENSNNNERIGKCEDIIRNCERIEELEINILQIKRIQDCEKILQNIERIEDWEKRISELHNLFAI